MKEYTVMVWLDQDLKADSYWEYLVRLDQQSTIIPADFVSIAPRFNFIGLLRKLFLFAPVSVHKGQA